MSYLLESGLPYWRCDVCGVETVRREPQQDDRTFGWAWDYQPGGPHHYCPQCRIDMGMESGLCEELAA